MQLEIIQPKIYEVRGEKVMLDFKPWKEKTFIFDLL